MSNVISFEFDPETYKGVMQAPEGFGEQNIVTQIEVLSELATLSSGKAAALLDETQGGGGVTVLSTINTLQALKEEASPIAGFGMDGQGNITLGLANGKQFSFTSPGGFMTVREVKVEPDAPLHFEDGKPLGF